MSIMPDTWMPDTWIRLVARARAMFEPFVAARWRQGAPLKSHG